MTQVSIHGDGGHARVVRDILDQIKGHKKWSDYLHIVVAVGDNAARKKEAERLRYSYDFATVIHPKAIVASTAVIEEGTVICAGAVVGPYARVGKHCIVNTLASVDHDSIVEDYAHIAPGAHLCGGVRVREGALVGVGVGIAPGADIPAWHLVKARRLEIEPLPSNG